MLYLWMDAMFMKAMNSKTSDPGSLFLNIFQNKKKMINEVINMLLY